MCDLILGLMIIYDVLMVGCIFSDVVNKLRGNKDEF